MLLKAFVRQHFAILYGTIRGQTSVR